MWDIEHAPTIDPKTLPIVRELERAIEQQDRQHRQALENAYKLLENAYKLLEEINQKISEIQSKLESKRNKDDNEHDYAKRSLENNCYGEACRNCIHSAPVYGSDKVRCLSDGDCFVKIAHRKRFK